ncbi:hypothetical protein FOA52_008123 [Chlamydomonas sp. UWO 241]|nr:hypothetical protein FOA52_008123 [Chlamydomonas sp. UWO 241]
MHARVMQQHLMLLLLLATTATSMEYTGRIPAYTRGPQPNFMIPARNLANGVTFFGSHERLRLAMDRLARGDRTLVAVTGGSNTVGHGALNGFGWPVYLDHWLRDTFPAASVKMFNGAVAGSTSEYMSVCTLMHVPRNASIVVLEYGHNDLHHTSGHEPMDNPQRRPFERLVRKVLNYPNRPAVILLNAYAWHETSPFKGAYWDNAEHAFSEYSSYYELPSLSVKACCYHLMRNNTPGFRIDVRNRTPETAEELKWETFYSDGVHGSGDTGHRVMAELLIHSLMLAQASLKFQPISEADRSAAAAPLPPPMVPGNDAGTSDRCLIGRYLTKAVSGDHPGWAWVDESRAGQQAKLGFVSNTTGASISFKVDTTSQIARSGAPKLKAEGEATATQETAGVVTVGIMHLQSYEGMGKGTISCGNGCTCSGEQGRLTIDGHDGSRKVSQVHMHSLFASQAKECVITVTVAGETSSGGHKVKVQGIFVSEEAVSDGSGSAWDPAVSNGVLGLVDEIKGDLVEAHIG